MKLHSMGVHEGTHRVIFHCPGCECGHQIPTTGPHAWQWNGSYDSPTFHPSILVNRDSINPQVPRCHSFVKDGHIQFLNDCTHPLANQTVAIPDWDENKNY